MRRLGLIGTISVLLILGACNMTQVPSSTIDEVGLLALEPTFFASANYQISNDSRSAPRNIVVSNLSNGLAVSGSFHTWQDANQIELNYNPNTQELSTTVTNNETSIEVSRNVGELDSLNYLRVFVGQGFEGASIEFNDVNLNNVPIGDFYYAGGDDPDLWGTTWDVPNLDLSGNWIITGTLQSSGHEEARGGIELSILVGHYSVPTSAEQCKNGGWQDLTNADGEGFRNQGLCIKFVNTGK